MATGDLVLLLVDMPAAGDRTWMKQRELTERASQLAAHLRRQTSILRDFRACLVPWRRGGGAAALANQYPTNISFG